MEEKISEKVEKILNLFMQEEAGNRLSQFAMLALKQAILSEVVKLEPKVE